MRGGLGKEAKVRCRAEGRGPYLPRAEPAAPLLTYWDELRCCRRSGRDAPRRSRCCSPCVLRPHSIGSCRWGSLSTSSSGHAACAGGSGCCSDSSLLKRCGNCRGGGGRSGIGMHGWAGGATWRGDRALAVNGSASEWRRFSRQYSTLAKNGVGDVKGGAGRESCRLTCRLCLVARHRFETESHRNQPANDIQRR